MELRPKRRQTPTASMTSKDIAIVEDIVRNTGYTQRFFGRKLEEAFEDLKERISGPAIWDGDAFADFDVEAFYMAAESWLEAWQFPVSMRENAATRLTSSFQLQIINEMYLFTEEDREKISEFELDDILEEKRHEWIELANELDDIFSMHLCRLEDCGIDAKILEGESLDAFGFSGFLCHMPLFLPFYQDFFAPLGLEAGELHAKTLETLLSCIEGDGKAMEPSRNFETVWNRIRDPEVLLWIAVLVKVDEETLLKITHMPLDYEQIRKLIPFEKVAKIVEVTNDADKLSEEAPVFGGFSDSDESVPSHLLQ